MRQQESLASLDGGITAPVTAPSPAAVVLNDSMDAEQSSVHNSTTVNETVDEEEQAPSGSETPSKREIGVCTIISYALNADWRFRSEQDAETQTQ